MMRKCHRTLISAHRRNLSSLQVFLSPLFSFINTRTVPRGANWMWANPQATGPLLHLNHVTVLQDKHDTLKGGKKKNKGAHALTHPGFVFFPDTEQWRHYLHLDDASTSAKIKNKTRESMNGYEAAEEKWPQDQIIRAKGKWELQNRDIDQLIVTLFNAQKMIKRTIWAELRRCPVGKFPNRNQTPL